VSGKYYILMDIRFKERQWMEELSSFADAMDGSADMRSTKVPAKEFAGEYGIVQVLIG
jgi:hypothetical protein